MSEKEKTNRKWTSSDKYRDNHDAIFGKKQTYVPTDEEQAFIDSHTDEKIIRLLVQAGLTESEAKAALKTYSYNQDDAMQELVELSEQWGLYDREAAEHLKDIRSDRLSDILDAPLGGAGADNHVIHPAEYKRMALNIRLAAQQEQIHTDKYERISSKPIKKD